MGLTVRLNSGNWERQQSKNLLPRNHVISLSCNVTILLIFTPKLKDTDISTNNKYSIIQISLSCKTDAVDVTG